MKKYIIFFFLIHCFNFNIQSQVSEKSYQNAIDYLNCKSVELSLLKDSNFEKFKEICSCENTNYDQIIDFLNSSDLSKTISLAKEIELLKKDYKLNQNKNDIIKFLTSTIFENEKKYQSIHKFALIRKNDTKFKEYKTVLDNKFKVILEEIIVEKEKTNNQELEDKIHSLENEIYKLNNKGWFEGVTSQIIIVSVIISLIFSLLILLLANKLDNDINDELLEKISKLSSNNLNNNRNDQQFNKYNSQINELKKDLEKFENKLNKIQSTTDNKSNNNQKSTPTINRNEEIRKEVFYLSIPNDDGSFNSKDESKSFEDGTSIYRFEKEGNRAIFQIENTENAILLALDFHDKRILPVCVSENNYNSNCKKINTVTPGKAELQNGKWIVNQKAKIRYEY